MVRQGIRWSAAALVLSLSGGLAVAQLPENPALSRSVALIESGVPQDPHIPPVRTSLDGRLGLNMKEQILLLLSPERLSTHFNDSSDGATIVADPVGVPLVVSQLHGSTWFDVADGHSAVCEDGPNPVPCSGPDIGKDCYTLTVITPVFERNAGGPGIDHMYLWGTEITVKVSDPKTDLAQIDPNVVYGTPVRGHQVIARNMFETMVSADGRLITGRFSNSNADLPGIDIFYAVGDEADAPCDVTQWERDHFESITHAYWDPRMLDANSKPRYGFAAYQMRDPEGNLIGDGVDLHGSYPWMDRTGANLFFTTVHATLWYRPTGTSSTGMPYLTRFPVQCVPGVSCLDTSQMTHSDVTEHDEASRLRGTSMVGSWTRGKIVMLDGILNNNDYGTKIEDEYQRMVQLYESGSGPGGDGWVRVGMGRNNGGLAEFPPGYVNNGTFIESTEQLFNALDQLRPRTPRDVVWFVNTGRVSDEVAFDDWVSPHGFVNSEMNMSMTWAGSLNGLMELYDGFAKTANWTGDGFDGTREVRVQNSATGHTVWKLPTAGHVVGNARMEPVALGGIRGHGLWLDGDTGIRYDVPQNQPQSMDDTHWYAGLFIDARFGDDSTLRDLLRFPDGSRVQLEGRSRIRFVDGAGTVMLDHGLSTTQKIPQIGWFHIGLLIDPGGQRVRLYRNGDRIRTWNGSQPLFRLESGTTRGELWVGKIEGEATEGFRGWVDEFKLFAERPNREVICNHARGTMVEAPYAIQAQRTTGGGTSSSSAGGSSATFAQAEATPQPAVYRYCFHDYSTEIGAHLGNIPSNATSIRERLIFPEGPLEFDHPRPDSASNLFCLSCHTADQVTDSLKVDALVANPIWLLQEDPRRQPMMPPRMISGHVPAGYYPSGKPLDDEESATGFFQDFWVFPDLP